MPAGLRRLPSSLILSEAVLEKSVYARICEVVARHTGAQIAPRHAPKKSITQYARARGFPTVSAYLDHVEANLEEELPHLCDHGLIHQTNFGRDTKFWESLQQYFFGHILPGEPVRILSLGCSNGHELATAAVLAHQRTEAKNIELDAWDISPKCVKDASNPTGYAKNSFLRASISSILSS